MMKLFKNKGQGSLEISILIILISLFILVYIILLPPAERESLLNETSSNVVTSEDTVALSTILSVSPGKVYPYSKNVQTYNLEPVHIFTKLDKQTTMLVKALTVSRNLLKDNYKNVIFSLDNLDNLGDLQLFMLIDDSKGRLKIKLNDRLVYQGFLTADQLPITLPKEYLRKSNKLEFSVELGGIFSSTYYVFKDISLIKDVETKSTSAERMFYVDMDKHNSIKSAKLYYWLTCNALEPRGILSIKLNNHLVLKDTVFCNYDGEINVPLDKTLFKQDGRNKIKFEIDKGDYNLDQVRVVTELTESVYPGYAFDVTPELKNDLKSGNKKLILKMSFADDASRKRSRIYVQGKSFTLDTRNGDYAWNIGSLVDAGSNYIKIIPLTKFEITNLKIKVENS